jgi:hypothetical protein
MIDFLEEVAEMEVPDDDKPYVPPVFPKRKDIKELKPLTKAQKLRIYNDVKRVKGK